MNELNWIYYYRGIFPSLSHQSALQYADSFGVYAKCLKAAASFVQFAHKSVRTEQLGHVHSKDVVRSKERSPWKKNSLYTRARTHAHTYTHTHTHTHTIWQHSAVPHNS